MPQVSPQRGVGSVQGRWKVDLPQGQVRGWLRGQGGHGLEWHTTSQAWCPHARGRPHTLVQCHREVWQGSTSANEPQQHVPSTGTWHGGQGPAWQGRWHACGHPSLALPHTPPQENSWVPHRRVVATLPQKHLQGTVWGQRGQGPAWHWLVQTWEHVGRVRPQLPPQVWGASHASGSGFARLPQKQRYAAG